MDINKNNSHGIRAEVVANECGCTRLLGWSKSDLYHLIVRLNNTEYKLRYPGWHTFHRYIVVNEGLSDYKPVGLMVALLVIE